MASSRGGAAVVVGVAVLDDHTAGIAAVLGVAEDGDARTRRTGDLETVESYVATGRQLDEVLGGLTAGSVDLRAPTVARADHNARVRGSRYSVAREPGVAAIFDRNHIAGLHRLDGLLQGSPRRTRQPCSGVSSTGRHHILRGTREGSRASHQSGHQDSPIQERGLFAHPLTIERIGWAAKGVRGSRFTLDADINNGLAVDQ